MTKADLLARLAVFDSSPCSCDPAWKDRGLTEPGCLFHDQEEVRDLARDAIALLPDDPAAGVPLEVRGALHAADQRQSCSKDDPLLVLAAYIRSLAPQPAALPVAWLPTRAVGAVLHGTERWESCTVYRRRCGTDDVPLYAPTHDHGTVAHAKSDPHLTGKRKAPPASEASQGEIPAGSAISGADRAAAWRPDAEAIVEHARKALRCLYIATDEEVAKSVEQACEQAFTFLLRRLPAPPDSAGQEGT